MSETLRVVAMVQAAPGEEAVVEAAIRACLAPSRAEPGCREYTAHRDMQVPGRFVFVERWDSPQALAEHEATAHFKAMADAIGPHLQGGLQVLRLQSLD